MSLLIINREGEPVQTNDLADEDSGEIIVSLRLSPHVWHSYQMKKADWLATLHYAGAMPGRLDPLLRALLVEAH